MHQLLTGGKGEKKFPEREWANNILRTHMLVFKNTKDVNLNQNLIPNISETIILLLHKIARIS